MKGIQEYTKEELLKKASPYWKSNEKILASSDGQFFYIDGEKYCDSHVRDNKLIKYLLTKSEYLTLINKKEQPKKVVDIIKEEPKIKVNKIKTQKK